MADDDDIDNQRLHFFNSTNGNTFTSRITDLDAMSCYFFGVRAYSDRGSGGWVFIANETLELQPSPTITATVNNPTDVESSIAAVAGGAVGGVVLAIIILFIIVLVVCLMRRRSIAKEKKARAAAAIDDDCGQFRMKDKKLSSTSSVQHNTAQQTKYDEPQYSTVPEVTYQNTTKSILNTNNDDNKESESIKVTVTEVSPPTSPNSVYTKILPPTEPESHYDVPTSGPTIAPYIPVTLPIALEDLGTHVANCHTDNNTLFGEQYKAIYNGEDKSTVIGFSQENKVYNRFRNITPYDDNRIVLTPWPQLDKCQTTYTNASYIDGYSNRTKFIASQGPMKRTLVDFWRLIWQEKPVSIVMVTNLKEGTKSKCEQYWPNSTGDNDHFGPFTVTLINEQVYPDFVIRQLNVKIYNGSNDSHTLTQYHLTSWPDHGVPDYATPLMSLHKQVMATWSPSKGPILVHCSAGVGRTGTFIAIDIALEQAKREGVVDIGGIVNRLRQQRMKMVQTLDQYVFLHDAVLETVMCGDTEIPSNEYEMKLRELKEIDSSTGCSGLQSQFELLSQVTPDPDDVFCDSAKAHSDKNRSTSYLPQENFLVTLKENNGYINASYLSGYREKKAFIIAQSPMENTARDFWKMIVDYKVSAIVMLCGLEEDGEESCYQYWRDSDVVQFGEYFIKVEFSKECNGYIERKFHIRSDKDESSWDVIQLQVTDWPQDGVVREPRTVLQVIDDVIHRQQKIGGGPVVVHCSDTVSRSGVYCSVSIGLEQCKAEGVVDVFQVTKAVRRSKPGAVTTLEQYTSIYDVIDKFLAINSTYANFK
ncbi:PREDICTED: receptor-type tyrosine-protein phosphatase epsilon-like [Amphimedon queenslandica]|uniref:protein-tyrosine-phosphatase n=1 Tax=Amphimedon queenslandica TaxID=400682 RepID=A0AAN0J4T2_AMPQE|nr:PREDICTED: receptor-type tyrosine-protein phosphatase epsilon-like [Amphimedon queenslandica]|eukprot:XP_019851757.1 PREDICTED: receptor-type tyrosine-protein phosphatase epsilon-like [Amphimedon queenslandica]